MLYAAAVCPLEVRAASDGGATISGRFPYGVDAELAPGRWETIASRALEAESDVRFLFSHDFARPLASVASGSLTLRNDAEALEFTATLPADVAGTSHGRDALALARAGLAVGLSPGFIVPDGGERVTPRGDGLLRTITRAALHELSLVTRPAYAAAAVEARSWDLSGLPAGDSGAGPIRGWWML